MKKAVTDTSALVSIALSGQLENAVKNIELFVPGTVFAELGEMSGFKDAEGMAAKSALSFIKKKEIFLVKVKNTKIPAQLVDKNVDLGEAECFVLAAENKIETILLDDVTAAYSLNGPTKSKNITLKISAAAIVELIRAEKISKKDGVLALEKMVKNRQWEKGVLKHMINKYLTEI